MKPGGLVKPTDLDWGVGTIGREFPESPEYVDVLFRVEYTICGYRRHNTYIIPFHKSKLTLVNED
jgi:hypothetical protein